MKKRIVSILLVLALALSLAPFALAAGSNFKKSVTYVPFADVPSGEWYASSVKGAVEYGLLNGKSTSVFDPNGNITIAESITLACRIHSISSTGATLVLSGGDPWYQPYVDYAEENGIISAGAYKNFDANATRADFVYIINRAVSDESVPAINTVADGTIPDVPDASSWWGAAVYRMYRAGILMGNDDYGTFNPNSSITRAEVSAIANRIADPDVRVFKTLKIGVSSVSVSPASLSLEPGQTANLTAAVSPANAENKALTWTSSNPAVATVSASGTVTAVSGGSAVITATSVNGIKGTCSVSVVVKTVLYAPDGRVIQVDASQVAQYTAVGWFTTPQTLKVTDSGDGWEYGSGVLICSYLPTSYNYRDWSSDIRNAASTLYIKRGVTSVPTFMFDQHSKLSHVEISDTVTNLEHYCFDECALTRIGIPKSVTSMDAYVFTTYGSSKEWGTNSNMVIYCEAGSTAESFAKSNGIKYVTATIVYHPDGRTMMVSAQERPAYLAGGWYSAPVVTMYAADGRTKVVYESEVAANEKVGWHANKYDVYTRMYAIDGRSKDVLNKDVAANQAVGWYLADDYVCALADQYVYSDGYGTAYDFVEYMLMAVSWTNSEQTKLTNKMTSLLNNWAIYCGAPMAIEGYTITYNSIGTPEANITFRNLSPKTVTYLEVCFTCIDARGNATTDYPSLYNGTFTGWTQGNYNIKTGESYTFTWSLYSNEKTRSLSNMYMNYITYSDGSVWSR